MAHYDAFLLISFGGPEKHEDVIPFLCNVLRGRNVPRERMLEVAEHYYHFDGFSPINDQCRELLKALKERLDIPIYWGNRNWHPMLEDTLRQMRDNGVRRAVALATSAFGSYSGCRQYREDIERTRALVADAPQVDKIPPFCLHPGFIGAVENCVREAMAKLPDAQVVYTAHSIPVSMAQSAPYEHQLRTVARTVNERLGLGEPTMLYQSRSGPPTQPWLEPDVTDYIRSTEAKRLIVVPVGFLSDHMEVLYDLDTEAKAAAEERGIEFVRAATVGTRPDFVDTIEDLVRSAVANGINACAPDCCKPAARPQRPA